MIKMSEEDNTAEGIANDEQVVNRQQDLINQAKMRLQQWGAGKAAARDMNDYEDINLEIVDGSPTHNGHKAMESSASGE